MIIAAKTETLNPTIRGDFKDFFVSFLSKMTIINSCRICCLILVD